MFEKTYPCVDCGVLRTEKEGGAIFTVCDDCYDKHYKPKKAKTPEDEAEKYAGNNMRIVGEPHECDSTREDLQQAHLAGQSVGEQRKQAEIERLNALLKQTEYMLLKADEREESAERRGEERGWKAARRATNGCVISMDYSEGGGPRFVAISDWRASEEYKEEE